MALSRRGSLLPAVNSTLQLLHEVHRQRTQAAAAVKTMDDKWELLPAFLQASEPPPGIALRLRDLMKGSKRDLMKGSKASLAS